MIQTVEQAINAKDPYSFHETSAAFNYGFHCGMDYQIERGIPWISVDNDELPEVGEWVFILLEGETFLKGRRKYKTSDLKEIIWTALFLDGENTCKGRTVTHYAYVNLPKINK